MATLNHHLDEERGLLSVEVSGPLESKNFDDIAQTVDPWIKKHGDLHGLVIHAKKFPGWENMGSFINHMKFVKNHHQNVHRVALATDGPLPTILPKVAQHFVRAEIRGFKYDEFDDARLWAAS